MFDLAGKFPHLRNPTAEREGEGGGGRGRGSVVFFFCVLNLIRSVRFFSCSLSYVLFMF